MSTLKWLEKSECCYEMEQWWESLLELYEEYKEQFEDEELGDYEDNFVFCLKYYFENVDESDSICQAMKLMEKAINNAEDALEIIFGDHVEVTVTREGIDVCEFEHE